MSDIFYSHIKHNFSSLVAGVISLNIDGHIVICVWNYGLYLDILRDTVCWKCLCWIPPTPALGHLVYL